MTWKDKCNTMYWVLPETVGGWPYPRGKEVTNLSERRAVLWILGFLLESLHFA